MYRLTLSLCISILLSLPMAGNRRYNAVIRTPKGTITGICMVAEDSIATRGVVMNEFGIKALEFVRGKKMKLTHVVPMLDRWYIRMTLKKDLCRLLDSEPNADGSLRYTNSRRHITYTLTPIDDTP